MRKPRENLRQLIEQLHINVTLSIFSINKLVHLQPQPDTIVTRTKLINIFSYNFRVLLLTYGCAMAAGLVAIAVGLNSYYANGVSMKGGFLAILATTRNRRLDELVGGACLGAEPVLEGVKEVSVKFGEIEGVGSGGGRATERHTAFGVEGQVRGIRYRSPWS
ncbi:hypothetical protein FGG08_006491 [Glutinoglossum americanum]|uniref:Uncharacterized protein n=1 Tax=Glutinoglossum americanum TaxID=1670608 RepID=A0A9P8I168_9PEZI|nr:hypothetical protein FGG08_006491 [Glutinoglossum americanum]